MRNNGFLLCRFVECKSIGGQIIRERSGRDRGKSSGRCEFIRETFGSVSAVCLFAFVNAFITACNL